MKTSLFKNWKTSLAGILTLSVIAVNASQNPSTLQNPQTIAAIAGAIGLILAADSQAKPAA